MRPNRPLLRFVVFGFVLALLQVASSAAEMATRFTYEGQLEKNGLPEDAVCKLQFTLWDALVGGTQIGAAQSVNDVQITDGLFSAPLDLEAALAHQGQKPLWLEISVQCPEDAFMTVLSPRQAVNSPMSSGGNTIAGDNDDDDRGSTSWQTRGNKRTNPRKDFLGTRDNRDLLIKTNRIQRMQIGTNGTITLGTVADSVELNVIGQTTTSVLTITGGADLAEPFAASDGGVFPAGALVAIDADDPGKLTLSDRPYDSRVAGVVSGAGGVKPGLTLSQANVTAEGQHVALAGRVYALATASNGSIRPGDLLTTSSTPGYAMKATDRDRSYGAVIGKAMSSLDKGTGLVLVLVQPR